MPNVLPMQAETDATGQLVYKAVAQSCGFEVKVIDNEHRVLRFVISKEIRDRDGDIVRQRGIDTTNYQKNPVVFWGHQSWSFPIAKTIKLKKEKGADGVWLTWADAQFASLAEQGHAEADLAFALCRDGYVNAASQGFRIASWKQLADALLTEDEIAARNAGQWVRGIDIVTSELYEWSPVGIPANPGAEIQRSGLVGSPEWPVKRVLDVAREKLGNGAKLEAFRRSILGTEEAICVGCVPTEKAPERFRALLSGDLPASVEDDGFDLAEKSAPPAEPVAAPATPPEERTAKGEAPPAAKAAEPSADAYRLRTMLDGALDRANDPEACPKEREAQAMRAVVLAKALDKQLDEAAAAALETRLAALAGSIGALAGMLEATVSRLTAACASMEACCARMEAVEPEGEAAPMSMASFAGEVRKALADHRAEMERFQIDVWGERESEKEALQAKAACGCNKQTKAAPADATPDPAPVAKGADTPASAEVPAPDVKAVTVAAARIDALGKRLNEFLGIVE